MCTDVCDFILLVMQQQAASLGLFLHTREFWSCCAAEVLARHVT